MVSTTSLFTLTTSLRTAASPRMSATTARSESAGSAPAASSAPKKDFATVAQDARSAIDTAYAARGEKADSSTHIDDWRDIMKGMDRRSLYAVFSNAGGQFSEDERTAAENLMHEDYWRNLGVDVNDVTSLERATQDPAALMKNAVKFWDSVSDEEKQSPLWAFNRGRSQYDYETQAKDKGETPENLDTTHPLASAIKSAMTAASLIDPSLARSQGMVDTIEGLLGQSWARGFEEQLKKAASAATVARGGFLNGTL